MVAKGKTETLLDISRKPRLLKANEISCRVQQVTANNSALILLYKDARVDMDILDETWGNSNWQREFFVLQNNLYCTIKTRESPESDWVIKQDVGTESDTEAVKGQASDAFKRAAVNVGIGRELYTGPIIFVNLKDDEVRSSAGGKKQTTFKFGLEVSEVTYNDDREIASLILVDKGGAVRFKFDKKQVKGRSPAREPSPIKELEIETPVAPVEPSPVDKLIQEIDKQVKIDTKGMGKEEKGVYGNTRIKPFTNDVLNYKGITDVDVLKALHAELIKA